MPTNFDGRLRALIEAHEGRVSFMYCDTAGIVTVGVGHAVFTADEASRLRFHHRTGIAPASPAEISDEWARVKSIRLGPCQEGLAALFMPDDNITGLLYEDLARFTQTISQELPHFAALPDDARLACFDIAFNCGSLHGWPKLRAAIAERDWASAARECFRPTLEPRIAGIADAPNGQRNKDTRALFLACTQTV